MQSLTSSPRSELTLASTSQTIIVRGQNLKPAMEAVAGFRLNVMRELPAIYQRQNWEDVPLITKISVYASEK